MVNDYYADQVLKEISEQKEEKPVETTAETVVEK